VNIAILFISGPIIYSLLRKLGMPTFLSIVVSILIIMQPVSALQMLTFMQDGFGYQLLLIVGASLMITMISTYAYWAIAAFIMSELLLVTTKYSHLPVAFIIGLIFGALILNRFLNRNYTFNTFTKVFLTTTVLVSLIFAFLPYGRNMLAHGAMFYPT